MDSLIRLSILLIFFLRSSPALLSPAVSGMRAHRISNFRDSAQISRKWQDSERIAQANFCDKLQKRHDLIKLIKTIKLASKFPKPEAMHLTSKSECGFVSWGLLLFSSMISAQGTSLLGRAEMTTVGLLPQPVLEPDAEGQFLTFVVPAQNGCNLRCSFCLVRQRREITDTRLRPGDFARFIREAWQRAPIFALAIQGYEPLLPDSLPYTQSILATGQFLGLPTSLVTNGLKLVDAVDLLKTLSPNKIAISLDSAATDIYDRTRRLAGA